jgi:signal transduction histidine kinase
MRPLPFRIKIALLTAATAGLGLMAFGITASWLVESQKIEAVDTEIRLLGARHPGWIAAHGNFQRLDESLAFIFGETHASNVVLMVKDVGGAVLYTSAGWPPGLDPQKLNCRLEDDPNARAPATNRPATGDGIGRGRGGTGRGLGPGGGGPAAFTKIPRFQNVKTHDGEWRLGMLGTTERTLVIGLNFAPVRADMLRLRVALAGAGTAALLLVALGGWHVAGRAVRPLRTIAETAERVTASGLDARIPAANDAPEIARVIQVLNRMMDRLEASFRQATRFTADASHELKTPLAIMQGELENALQAAAPGSRGQQLFADLLEEVQRLKEITRSLLLLAQADAGQLKLALETTDLSATLEGMVEDARVLADGKDLAFDVQIPPGVRVPADRALLTTAVFNLIGNAIKHNHHGGRVALRLEAHEDKATVLIGNSGPEIPAAGQSKIFDRFFRIPRGDRARVEGTGLGLSLAREIVRAHGGELRLHESRAGWTTFELRLPAISAGL